MFDKLNTMADRFRELEEEIVQPDIIQDYEKYHYDKLVFQNFLA